ncbi:hypothetical protein ACQJBY_013075 [Aegilops geniculata]
MASPGGDEEVEQQKTDGHFSGSRSSSSSRDSVYTSGDINTGERSHCEATEPTSIPLKLLEKITNDFSEEQLLGYGAYGRVYRGVCDDGREIAVKRLHNNIQTIDDKQFIQEFDNLMMLNHPNIIRLVGYCYETQREHTKFEGRVVFAETTYKALCFEYMSKGSLKKHISDECVGLDWKTRYKIIKGACEGLKYLHEGFKNPFYHLDLKPDNILLDENLAPKLADFGLSKLAGEEQTRITQSPIAGTRGYMAPEYFSERKVSKKLDIFSLGVVMTDIIAGPSGHTRYAEMQYQEFLDQVGGNWRKRLQTIWSSPEPLEAHCKQVKRCTEIALRCMDDDRHKRPSIVDTIHELNKTELLIERATDYEQDLPTSNSNFVEKITYYEQEPSAPPASNSNMMEMVTYFGQEPSALPASTSNVVQPVVSAPLSTALTPPSPPPSYIGSPTPRQRPPPVSSYVMSPPPPPPRPPSGGFMEFFRAVIHRKPKIIGHAREFSYRQLKTATREFAEIQKIGEGGFGRVYKGIVTLQDKEGKDKDVQVAIKKSTHARSDQARQAFNNEIDIMSPLNHCNIIRLMGWCVDRQELFLVYELAEDLNLEARLYSSTLVLDWHQRYNILVGIASGLEYLHYNCAKTVLHMDIKPGNVMLDRNFRAKLCDFGLVTQLTHAVTSVSTEVVIGTQAYMDPLCWKNKKISKDSDVYSFGVLLLEVLCAAKPILLDIAGKNTLIERVRECQKKNAIFIAADTRLGTEFKDKIEGALSIGLHCVEARRGDRPTIAIVLSLLRRMHGAYVSLDS